VDNFFRYASQEERKRRKNPKASLVHQTAGLALEGAKDHLYCAVYMSVCTSLWGVSGGEIDLLLPQMVVWGY